MVLVIRKKYIIIGLMCCILLIALPFAFARLAHSAQQTVTTAAANTNWGLGFKENGKQPTGNASPEYLKQYQAYYVGSADKKVIYLTFDAGYEAGKGEESTSHHPRASGGAASPAPRRARRRGGSS
jgi:peptidoglycan-N-acetylmuramic acid deacetylase